MTPSTKHTKTPPALADDREITELLAGPPELRETPASSLPRPAHGVRFAQSRSPRRPCMTDVEVVRELESGQR